MFGRVIGHARWNHIFKICPIKEFIGRNLIVESDFVRLSMFSKMLSQLESSNKSLNVPRTHSEQQTGGQIDQRMARLTKAEEHVKQDGERETGHDGHQAHNRVDFNVLFRWDGLFKWFGKIGQKDAALTAIRLRRLVRFSALWTKHNEFVPKVLRTSVAKVHNNRRRRSSFTIDSNSRLTCPAADEFSSARRIKYGTTSATGP